MTLEESKLADFICETKDRLGPGCDELAIAQAILRIFCVARKTDTDDGRRTLPEAEEQIERLNSRIVELLRERDALRNAVIEECAKLADEWATDSYNETFVQCATEMAFAIRALGAKP